MKELNGKLKTLLVLMLTLSMLFAACKKPAPEETTPAPVVTQAPEVEYSIVKLACYWPENSDPSNCEYSLYVEKPEFSQAFTAGYALNRAVDNYISELTDRIETKYIPAAVAKNPYTHVTCSVERMGKFTNIIFTENENYEVQPYSETYVLMLDERGNEINLCDIFYTYHAEQLVADRIAELISDDGRYFPVDNGKIIDALDIVHGAKITPYGAVIYIHEGLLAPHEEGELKFDIKSSEICPVFVGEEKALSYDEYITLTDFLGMVCDSVIVRGDNVVDGVMTDYSATVFMAEASQRMNLVPSAGRINVPEADFEEYFRGCFGTDFPEIDLDAHDIKHPKDTYSVLARKLEYTYYVDMLSAEWADELLTINGDLTFGTFGYAFTAPVCHVTIELVRNETSPFGFTVRSFLMNL